MRKNRKKPTRGRAATDPEDRALPDPIRIAEKAINEAVGKIRTVEARFAAGILHGAYGKQEIVQACYRALIDLERHRLAPVIRGRMKKRTGDAGSADLAVLLLRLALPELQSAVVSNWAGAMRFAQDHHVRPTKVRGFLYVKGGINACAARYRASVRAKEDEGYADEGFVPRKRDRSWDSKKRPDRTRTLFN